MQYHHHQHHNSLFVLIMYQQLYNQPLLIKYLFLILCRLLLHRHHRLLVCPIQLCNVQQVFLFNNLNLNLSRSKSFNSLNKYKLFNNLNLYKLFNNRNRSSSFKVRNPNLHKFYK